MCAEAELRDQNLGNLQEGVLVSSRSQTKPPSLANKPLLHRLCIYTGF